MNTRTDDMNRAEARRLAVVNGRARDWRIDYAPDAGMTAVCPECDSEQVEDVTIPSGPTVLHCLSCDHTSKAAY